MTFLQERFQEAGYISRRMSFDFEGKESVHCCVVLQECSLRFGESPQGSMTEERPQVSTMKASLVEYELYFNQLSHVAHFIDPSFKN